MIKRETYMSRIRPFIGDERIKILIGIRRSGKSVMLNLIQDELVQNGVNRQQFICLNFESMSNAHLCTAAALHDAIIRQASEIGGKAYLFFDEIQEVESWETCIHSLRLELDCDIYLTSSNAKLLSDELTITNLSGQYLAFAIYPFSFAEFIELYRSVYPDTDLRQCFDKYLLLGGMPYLSNLRFDETTSRQYLQDLFYAVELKDIVKQNNIRDVDMLERILSYITTNIGSIFSSTMISKYLKSEGRPISPETVLNYIKACTEAFLFYRVKRQYLQGRKILTVNEKYYMADHGVREAVFGGNTRDINLILENIVYIELLRRDYLVTVGKISNKEIDFVCEKHGNKLYIQVAHLLASEDSIHLEFGAFFGIRDNFPKYVVTMDEFDMSRDGIKHRNIRDFLLAEEWN